MKYMTLSKRIMKKIEADLISPKVITYQCLDQDAIRRDATRDVATLWRPAFIRDVEKILQLPLYNRYADKTQVFSFYYNDDITRRALHVQLVSRIARNIGKILRLNLDLIEAISLGHDMGHTPFGHAGERFLNSIFHEKTGGYFSHNMQTVRVLDKIFCSNLSLQSLDGMLCHNGAFEKGPFRPRKLLGFEDLDKEVKECAEHGKEAIIKLRPGTLEGCLVRICDMVAYLGKDRQDAEKAHIIDKDINFSMSEIGVKNSEMINNISVDIIENSYGKDCICMSDKVWEGLKTAKEENNRFIYKNEKLKYKYEETIKPMFRELYERLLEDVVNKRKKSIIFDHHIDFVNKSRKKYNKENYLNEEPNHIVSDFIASMTDDYFIELHKHLFPHSKYKVDYVSYFE